MAVGTLSYTINIFNAALTVRVLAHKVHSWQIQFSLTVVASLLVIEIDCSLLHLCDLLLAVANLGHFLIFAGIVLIDALLLSLQVLKQERFYDAEGQLLVRFEDFEHEKRR